MKKNILILAVALISNTYAFARQGEHDGDPKHNDGRTIICKEKMTGAVVLQFVSNQAQGQVSTSNYDLVVKSRGDDIGELTVIDKRSGVTLKAKRLEELLKTTLISTENPNPVVIEVKTNRGYGESEVISTITADKGFVKSLSRRGQNFMEVDLLTNENPSSPIGIFCQTVR